MAFKVVLSFALLAAISAVPVQQYHAEHEAPAHYTFTYSVNNEHTGDIKSQSESREGDAVKGHYELIDSDGFKRTVEYTADDVHGFVAVVHREPTNIKIPLPAPHPYSHAPSHFHSAAAAPVAHYAQTPVAHYTPVQQHASYAPKHVSPVVHKQIVVAPTTAAPVIHHHQPTAAPVQHVQYVAPVHHVQHVAPVHEVHHSTPVHHVIPVQHAAPVQHGQNVAPVQHVQHVAPVQHVQHVAPIQHVAPVQHVQHVAPVQHVVPVHHLTPVHRYVAPVVASHQLQQTPDHVHFNAPGFNYNY